MIIALVVSKTFEGGGGGGGVNRKIEGHITA